MNADWFAPRLRELREGAGWSQQQLADRAGLSLGGIRDLEQEKTRPLWETVLLLCQALAVDPLAFLQEPAQQIKRSRGRPRRITKGGITSPAAKGKPKTGKRK